MNRRHIGANHGAITSRKKASVSRRTVVGQSRRSDDLSAQLHVRDVRVALMQTEPQSKWASWYRFVTVAVIRRRNRLDQGINADPGPGERAGEGQPTVTSARGSAHSSRTLRPGARRCRRSAPRRPGPARSAWTIARPARTGSAPIRLRQWRGSTSFPRPWTTGRSLPRRCDPWPTDLPRPKTVFDCLPPGRDPGAVGSSTARTAFRRVGHDQVVQIAGDILPSARIIARSQ